MQREIAILNRLLTQTLIYWNENASYWDEQADILELFPLSVNSKWASPEGSAGLRFLGKFLIFSGCLIFIPNPLDEINASTLEDQATLNITPAANNNSLREHSFLLHFSLPKGCWAFPPLCLLTHSSPTQQCQCCCL